MNPANSEKTRDVGSEVVIIDSSARNRPVAKGTPSKMYLRRNLILCFLTACVFLIGLCSAIQAGNPSVPTIRRPKNPTVQDQRRFQELLRGIEPGSLHEILHEKIDKYKHGVFQGDADAIAVVHQQSPEVASSLIELAKRQAVPSPNSTTIIPPATSTTAVTTEETSTFVTPITSSTVVTQTSEGSSSSSATQEITSAITSQSTIVSTSFGTSSSEIVISSNTEVAPTSTSNGTYDSGPAVYSLVSASPVAFPPVNPSDICTSSCGTSVASSSILCSSSSALYSVALTPRLYSNSTLICVTPSHVSSFILAPAKITAFPGSPATSSCTSSFSYASISSSGRPYLVASPTNSILSDPAASSGYFNASSGPSSPSGSSNSPTSTSTSGSPSSLKISTLPSSRESNSPTETPGSKSTSSSSTSTPSVTSYDIFTTTLPDGKPTTVTQTTVVPAAQADQTPAGGSSTKTNPGASLQTNGASTARINVHAIAGIVGMLFITIL